MTLTNTMPSPRLASMVLPTCSLVASGQLAQVELDVAACRNWDVGLVELGLPLTYSVSKRRSETSCTSASEMCRDATQPGRLQRQFGRGNIDAHAANHDGYVLLEPNFNRKSSTRFMGFLR